MTQYDEVAESAVCEIGNMIGGEASKLLHEEGYKCDITVPSIVKGKEMEIAFYPAAPSVHDPLLVQVGPDRSYTEIRQQTKKLTPG